MPSGWRVRTIAAADANGGGAARFEFLSPDNVRLSSRKEVLDHLKAKKRSTAAAEPAEEQAADEERKQGEFKRWADIKMRQFRRKMPKRKRLVSNQVLVNAKLKALRRAAEQAEDGSAGQLFLREPVVFVPRLPSIVKNMDLKEELDNNSPADIRNKVDNYYSII